MFVAQITERQLFGWSVNKECERLIQFNIQQMHVHVNGHDTTITVILANHCIKLPDDGSLVIRNMLEQF